MVQPDAGDITLRHVLLIEDDLTLGELLVNVFTRHGAATVLWFVRARPVEVIDSKGLVLIDPDGRESVFPMQKPFDIAFVDYRLKMSQLTGLEVTRKLTAGGVKVIACSGLSCLNEEMLQAGAQAGMEKDKIFSRALRESDFINQLCSP